MFSTRGLSVIVVILVLLSGVLGWQVYSMKQSSSDEVARLRQVLTEKDAELAQAREAVTRANQINLDISKPRAWHIRAGQALVMGEVVLVVAPQATGIGLQVGVALRPGLFGAPSSVRVLTTAPNWGADDKGIASPGGVVRVQHQFPLAVTEATIALESR